MNNNVISRLYKGDTKSKWRIGANVATHNRQRECIRDLLEIAEKQDPMEKVLDCPSGAGRMVDLLLPWQVTCADITRSRLEDIKRYFPENNIDTRECDVFDLPFEDDEFDLVLNCLLIQHIDKSRLPSLLAELRRVTKKWLLLTYPSFFALINVYRLITGKDKTILTRKEFGALVSGAGLRIIDSRTVLPFLANSRVILLEKVT